MACRPRSLRGARVSRGGARLSRGASAAEGATRRALLIEFCGLPGAGKSHVAAALVNGLGRRGIPADAGDASIAPEVPPARRIPRKLLAAGGAVLGDPAGSVRAGLAISRGGHRAGDIVSRSLQWFVTQGVLDRASRRPGLHVFQEGVLQALWSVGLRGDPDGLLGVLESHADRWIRPHVVVVVNAPIEVAVARLGTRPSSHSRTQALGAGERAAELQRGQELLGSLVEWWEASSGDDEDIIQVDNGDDGPRNRVDSLLVNRVLARLEAPAGRRPGRGGVAIPF